jgi:hypothetical protein
VACELLVQFRRRTLEVVAQNLYAVHLLVGITLLRLEPETLEYVLPYAGEETHVVWVEAHLQDLHYVLGDLYVGQALLGL